MPVPYNLTIDWGDGTVATIDPVWTLPLTHTYGVSLSYQVSILGDLYRFSFRSQAHAEKIYDISSWGDGFFVDKDSTYMFAGCVNLKMTADAQTQPIFLTDATLRGMFMNSGVNSNFHWNLTNVQSLAEMFADSPMSHEVNFTGMDQVTDMFEMFRNANGFKQDLQNWTVNNVVNCSNFCEICTLPRFPLCEACTPKYRTQTTTKCTCLNANQCSVEVPANPTTFVVRGQPNLTVTVTIPSNPTFKNRSLVANVTIGTNKTLSDTVVSLELEDSLSDIVKVSNLSTPVSIVFALKIPRDTSAVTQCVGTGFVVGEVLPACSFFNDVTRDWETTGCYVAEANATHVMCNCTHFTLFAVLAPKHNKIVPSVLGTHFFQRCRTPDRVDHDCGGAVRVRDDVCGGRLEGSKGGGELRTAASVEV